MYQNSERYPCALCGSMYRNQAAREWHIRHAHTSRVSCTVAAPKMAARLYNHAGVLAMEALATDANRTERRTLVAFRRFDRAVDRYRRILGHIPGWYAADAIRPASQRAPETRQSRRATEAAAVFILVLLALLWASVIWQHLANFVRSL